MAELSSDALAVARGIDDLLAVGAPLAGLVTDYLSDEAPRFTGRHFHALGHAAADAWTAEDVAAIALLGTPIGGDGVERLLLTERQKFAELLAGVSARVTVWDAAREPAAVHEALDAASVLVDGLRGIRGIGWTRAHKLTARKRPDLHPVFDSVVESWFHDVNGIRYGLAELVAAGQSPADALREHLDPEGLPGSGSCGSSTSPCGRAGRALVPRRRSVSFMVSPRCPRHGSSRDQQGCWQRPSLTSWQLLRAWEHGVHPTILAQATQQTAGQAVPDGAAANCQLGCVS